MSSSSVKDDTTPTQLQANKKKTATPSWRDVAAGAGAGAFSRTVTAPLERIKLIIQLQHSIQTTSPNQKKQPSLRAWQLTKSVYQNEGLLSFWRGNLPSCMRVSGTAAINFAMMNYYKEVAVEPLVHKSVLLYPIQLDKEQFERKCRNLTSFVAGGMAGGTSTTLLYPIEFLRTRLTADLQKGKKTGSYKYKGMTHAFTSILKSDGIAGFFQGYGIALFGGIFYRVLFLGGYDVCKSEMERSNQLLKQQKQQHQTTTMESSSFSSSSSESSPSTLTWTQRIFTAQIVSLTAGTMSYPLDSVRRRLMMQAGIPQEQRLYRNSIHCIASVFQQEGMKGFFLGLGPNILRSVSGALLLVAYDVLKASLQ